MVFLNNPSSDIGLTRAEVLDFELLYLLETEPGLSQREMAARLGISVGKVNYCLKQLAKCAAVHVVGVRPIKTGKGRAFAVTPVGAAVRSSLAGRVLPGKIGQVERLKTQIAYLQRDFTSDQVDMSESLSNNPDH